MYYYEKLNNYTTQNQVVDFLSKYNRNELTFEALIQIDISLQWANKNGVKSIDDINIKKEMNLALKNFNKDFLTCNIDNIGSNLKFQIPIFLNRNYKMINNYENIILECLLVKILSPNIAFACCNTFKTRKKELLDFITTNIDSVPLLVDAIHTRSIVFTSQYFDSINKTISEAISLKMLNYNVLDKIEKMRGDIISSENKFHAKKLKKNLADTFITESSPITNFNMSLDFELDTIYDVHIEEVSPVNYNYNFTYNIKKHIDFKKPYSRIFKEFQNELGWIVYGQFVLSRYKSDGMSSLLFYSHENNFIKGSNHFFTTNEFSTSAVIYYVHSYCIEMGIDILKVVSYIYDFEIPIDFDISDELLSISENDYYKSKCQSICSSIESILRQFDQYTKKGFIDFGLLNNIQVHVDINNIKSLHEIKNLYLMDKYYKDYLMYLFNDYEDKKKVTYNYLLEGAKSIVELVETVDHHKNELENALTSDLFQNDGSSVSFDKLELFVLSLLDDKSCICYDSLSDNLKNAVVSLIEKGYIKTDNLLFSKEELAVYSYYMNDAMFVDGYYLRNKYQHGNAYGNDEDFYKDYLMLLRILILITLKIYKDCEMVKKEV